MINPMLLKDFYKVGHPEQYPEDTEQVWSNWTPRSSRVPGATDVVHFGLQYFIKKFLKEDMVQNFFGVEWARIEDEYKTFMLATLGIDAPTARLKALHELGYMPLDIYSLPEGTSVPLGLPVMVMTNTLPEFYWLVNDRETLMSSILWGMSTSATTARNFRRGFIKWARKFGEEDLSFVNWQGHDFSMRGMWGPEAAARSGMGHLLSFSGTDTIPAILEAHRYYGALLTCGGSVPATEHAVMCSGTKDGEFETFRRLIEDIYPTGIVSIVSDTWDLWKVLTDYIPRLKNSILARNGKVVIRPDSGIPELILCGNPSATEEAEKKGVFRLLAEALGTDGKGHINNAGAIYGDSITPDRQEIILSRMVTELGLSPYNCVLGIGSYAYTMATRDSYGFAMKATAVRRSGKVIPIFKDPVTDHGDKKSARGIPIVHRHPQDGSFFMNETDEPRELDFSAYEKVFSNGKLLKEYSFEEIQSRVRTTC